MKYMTLGYVFAMVCVDMIFVCMQWYAWTWITFYYLKGIQATLNYIGMENINKGRIQTIG